MSATYTTQTLPGRRPGDWLLAFYRDPLAALQRMAAASSADIVAVGLGTRRLYLAQHPDLVRDLLITHNDAFIKARALQLTQFILGHGLLTSEGAFHERQRKLVLPAFHHRRIAAYAEVMVEETRRMQDAWRPGEPLLIDRAMNHLALKIVARALFGASVEDEVERVSGALDAFMDMFKRTSNPFAEWLTHLPLPGTLRMKRARRVLDEIVYGMIRSRRADTADRGDLTSMLLAAREDGTNAFMDDQQVRDEVMTIFLAGHETTANALTWTWSLLAQHPEAEAALHAEVDRVLGGRPATMDDAPALVYTRQVFAEAMRLYPPAWAVSREAVREVTLGGVRIPAGATVLASQYLLHRDPRFWDAPEAFRPERFAPEAERPSKFVYFPFSVGRRGCIGEQFAWTEGVLVLATLAQRWRLALVEPGPPPYFPSITLRPARAIAMRPLERAPAGPTYA